MSCTPKTTCQQVLLARAIARRQRLAHLHLVELLPNGFQIGIEPLALEDLDQEIARIVGSSKASVVDLLGLINSLSKVLSAKNAVFLAVRDHFARGMDEVGKELDSMWGADRYVRSAPGEIIE